ncbi:SMI1/KNR4 family protein [Niallia taxi]|uniref:SMI1/KNR4 family protein n=1 Tax=Niallia taxi TaxID=2499688 RepID=UPI00203F298B|nr:SMI1/KNR4 family protein [Niallia taxi]MCM3213560.1 SMI1/KNR4 family protein [Niallia taxi]
MEFWNNKLKDDPYKLQNINKKDIELAEKAFHIKLPQAYIDLLIEQNGGYLEKTCLPVIFKNDWADDHILFDYLLGIKKDKGIMESNYLLKEWGVKEKNLIIISGDGHFFIALDYRTNEENPTIVYIDTTEDKITKIYEDFSTMVNSLYEEDVENQEDIEEMEELRKHLKDSKKRSIELMESMENDDIVEGIHMYVGANAGFIQDNDVFINKLIQFIQHSNEDIRLAAAECLWRSINNGNIKDNKVISLVLDIFKNENHPDIKYFYDDIIENQPK